MAADAPALRHACSWQVTITYTVEAGARPATGWARAERLARRLANAAARSSGVLEVSAASGPWGSKPALRRLQFEAANAGCGSYAQPELLDRYFDPDWQRDRKAVRTAEQRSRDASNADARRRSDLGCRNVARAASEPVRFCGCCYCDPADHLAAARLAVIDDSVQEPCPCGVHLRGAACGDSAGHRRALAVLEGDPPAARQVVAYHQAGLS